MVGWLALALLLPAAAAAQSAVVRGSVTDSTTGVPLPQVRVELSAAAVQRVVTTDDAGRFVFGGVPAGPVRLRFARIGYRPDTVETRASAGDTTAVTVRLTAVGVPLDPVVISASRTQETALDAPAAVSVIGRETLEETVTLAPVEVTRSAPGVDMASKGLIQRTFSMRGDASVNSGSVLFLQDFRYAALPAVAFNVPYLMAATTEDLDRIEVVRGPASALYGPGAPRGVLHFVSRSPFESRGGAVGVTGGSRGTIGADVRVAERLSSRLAVKLSGEYLRGDDWEATDAREIANRDAALAAGADPDTLLIGRRDYGVGRAAGEARLDWRPDDRSEVIATAGVSQALSSIDLTPAVGAIQGQDWRYSFGQLRIRRDRLSLNAFYNWSNAGDTYVLRTGEPLVDDSRQLVGQLQHGATLGAVDLLYGADVRWTDPRTEGTIHGLNEDRDRTTEIGGYGHATWAVSSRLQAVGALRLDHHSALNDLALSPRLALVYKPAPTHAVRAAYNRAFTSPDANDLFLDIRVGELPLGLPYDVRATGVPKDGYHFRRDCDGGLCMRSPFAPLAGGSQGEYLPTDATALWPAVVAYAKQFGIDLSGIPAPDGTQVGTTLGVLDVATETFVPIAASDVEDIEGEGRTITNAFEVGYKGFFAERIALTVDGWMSRVSDAAGPQVIGTPSAFFDEASLRDYLAGYMSAAEAEALARQIAQIPAGTISPEETPYPTDLLAVSLRGGAYTLWGLDVGVEVAVSRNLVVGGTYSWLSADSIPNVDVLGVVYLNAPRDKASARLEYRNGRLGVTAGAQGRYVRSFPMQNGVYGGHVDAYALLDVAAGIGVPGWRAATVTLAVQNLLDSRHVEVVGAPELGRLFLMRLRAGW